MEFLRNCWYLAAWENEVLPRATLARRILNEPVVLFRDESDRVVALHDRCPHRFAPLSKGSVQDGAIHCGYHGLGFASTGKCVINPHGRITSGLSVQAYPVTVKHRAVWIWMGEPDRAQFTEPPALSFFENVPDTAYSNGYLHAMANYALLVDNILDLTHTDFLHPDSLGGGSYTQTPPKITDHDRGVALHWHCWDEVPQPIMRMTGLTADKADFWTEIEWTAPSIMTIRNGSVPTGTPREEGKNFLVAHIMTPETETSSHYFFAATRDFLCDDANTNSKIAANRARIFSQEDLPMIEAQQSRMEGKEFWSLKPALLRSDEGAVRVRRKLEAMILEEKEEASAINSGEIQ